MFVKFVFEIVSSCDPNNIIYHLVSKQRIYGFFSSIDHLNKDERILLHFAGASCVGSLSLWWSEEFDLLKVLKR